MNNWFSVVLNGNPLEGVADTIVITDVQEGAPSITVDASQNAKYGGSHVMGAARTALSISIQFVIRERNILSRAAALDAVAKWIAEGKLEVNYRPNQHLMVVPTQRPSMSSWSWSDVLEIVFTAYDVPYWQDNTETVVKIAAPGSDLSCSIKPLGNVDPIKVSARLEFESEGTYLGIQAGSWETVFRLTGLEINAGDVIECGYNESGYLFITQNGESIMNKRNPNSTDDLLCHPGKETAISIWSDASLTAEFRARGLYE